MIDFSNKNKNIYSIIEFLVKEPRLDQDYNIALTSALESKSHASVYSVKATRVTSKELMPTEKGLMSKLQSPAAN